MSGLVLAFGLTALLLASLGIYGLMAFLVAQRTVSPRLEADRSQHGAAAEHEPQHGRRARAERHADADLPRGIDRLELPAL